MEISDVRVRMVKDAGDRLKAVCTVTLDGEFVVRDVKVVEGTNGLFVAMPSRKLTAPCGRCRTQNHLRAKHCNECGGRLPPARIPAGEDGREKAHRDIAHPINSAFRQRMQERVLEAYRMECEAVGPVGAPPEPESAFESEMEGEPETPFEEEVTDREQVHEHEREQEREHIHEDEGISDYNSLIADLRGGGGGGGAERRPAAGGGRGPRPQPSHSQPPRRPQPQGRGPRVRDDRREGGRPPGREEPPRQQGRPPEPRRDSGYGRGPRPSKWESQRQETSMPAPESEPEIFEPQESVEAEASSPMPPAPPTPPPPRPVRERPVSQPVAPRPAPAPVKRPEPEPGPEDSFGAGLL
jgi:stage V sporulation protein G